VTLPKFIIFYGEGSDGVLATKMKEEEGCPEDLDAVVAVEELWVADAFGHVRLGEVPKGVDGDGVCKQVGEPEEHAE
jgi:hypothetical protein